MDSLQGLKQVKFCQLLMGLSFLCSGILLNILQFIVYYSIRLFNEQLFRRINYYLSYSLYSHMVFLAQYWADVTLTVHMKKSDYERFCGKEHAYLIMNHSYEIDWIAGWILCDNIQVLGNVKTYAKKSIQYLPPLGWSWKFGGSIFLERNWEKDKEIIGKKLTELVNYKDPIWLLLAAEGTRFTKEKYELSKAFAKEKGLPILKHHLTPRTKGFLCSLPYLKKNSVPVYNIILGFIPGTEPTMKNIICGKSIQGNMFLERIPVSEIPDDEVQAEMWLHELYKKKDAMLDSLLQTGSWFEKSGVKEVEGIVMSRRIYPLLNAFAWTTASLLLIIHCIVKILMSGNAFYILAACAFIASLWFLLLKLVNETNIKKGSAYGTGSPTKMVNGISKKN